MFRFLRLGLALILLAGPAAAQVGIGFGGVAHDASQQVEVVADSLTVDRESGNAVFSGNVVIVQGDLRMAAGEVTVYYAETEGQTEVARVVATGGVLVTRGDDAAEGETAEYAVADASLTLSGGVMVTQGPTAIAGDRLIVDLETGSGTVTGRVRTVLQGADE
ncbi:lipopolysaccharide transport periplasmic protein LptA [Rhodobacterales bacterium HKCCE3408]|nr:lipopolysaccharide transport periplasmic protein LptA [Rhodobacterales bacterium HKCCE3408]